MRAMSDADLTIVVIDGTSPSAADEEKLIAKAVEQGRHLIVRNKSDLPEFADRMDQLSVSALTGAGIVALRQKILQLLVPQGPVEMQGGFITSARHEALLKECGAMLERAENASMAGLPHELILLDLYCALQALDSISGATTIDDILQ